MVLSLAALLPSQTVAEQTRESVIAGTWYPGNAAVLRQQIEGFLSKVPPSDLHGRLVALISPHAGYQYSGKVAAHAYKLLEGQSFDTVVVLAPSHHAAFTGVSVYDQGGYETPLGGVPLDMDFIEALAEAYPKVRYLPEAHAAEHAIEIQLPFLQTALSDFKLVPLVMGDQSYAACKRLGKAISKCAENRSVLLVASSDLSHYHTREEARVLDGRVADRVAGFDPKGLSRDISKGKSEACGGGPMIAVMLAAETLGAERAEVLETGDSGDAAGDTSRVVGYMAAAFWNEKEKNMSQEENGEAEVLDAGEQTLLKEIARGAISGVIENRPYSIPGALPDILKSPCGAFVTLTIKGQLRGCIGHITASAPLAETVRDVAMAAALEDPRFSPLTLEEWAETDIEVSVLTPLQRVWDMEAITPGVHGLYVRRGYQSGLLLPQVATEYGWNRETFLEQTCRKAGLRKNDWKDEDTEIYWFRAQVF